MPTVDLKRPLKKHRRAPRDLARVDARSSGSARFFDRMIRDIESDLGGRRDLTRIEAELIRAFAGSATMLQYQNIQLALGEIGEIDITGYSNLASTMLRIGSRLGLARRPRDVESLEHYLKSRRTDDGAPALDEEPAIDTGADPC